MPLMEEGASAPLELSRGGSQPKVSPRSSPSGRLRCRPHCHFVRMPHEKKQPVAKKAVAAAAAFVVAFARDQNAIELLV